MKQPKHIMVGGLVAMGFDASGRFLLTVSHSGRGVFAVDTWQRVARDSAPAYPQEGFAVGIGPLAGKRVAVVSRDEKNERMEIESHDGMFLLVGESDGISVSCKESESAIRGTCNAGLKMPHATTRAFYPRDLTEKERSFTCWLIDHAQVSEEEKKRYRGQLEVATVVRMCGCGCASIDLVIAGLASEPAVPLRPFGDFIAADRRFGVFVFAKHDKLAGVEIYSLVDSELPSEFPEPSVFTGWAEANPSSGPTATGG